MSKTRDATFSLRATLREERLAIERTDFLEPLQANQSLAHKKMYRMNGTTLSVANSNRSQRKKASLLGRR